MTLDPPGNDEPSRDALFFCASALLGSECSMDQQRFSSSGHKHLIRSMMNPIFVSIFVNRRSIVMMYPTAVMSVPPVRTELISKDRKSTRLNSSHQKISYAVF